MTGCSVIDWLQSKTMGTDSNPVEMPSQTGTSVDSEGLKSSPASGDTEIEYAAPQPPDDLGSEGLTELPDEEPVMMVKSMAEPEKLPEIAEDIPPPAGSVFPQRFAAVRPPRISMPVPVFPVGVDFDRLAGGWVRFNVRIAPDGSVMEVEVIESSHPDLVPPTVMALKRAKYIPATDPLGNPVSFEMEDRVDY